MVEYNSPVSFVWNRTSKKDGTEIVYCFAYVRNIETNEILYAGVKYVGSKEKFGNIKKNLRNTAIVRLIMKPIYAICAINEGEKVNEVLSKFFVYSSLKNKYVKLGLHSGKNSYDMSFYYDVENKIYKQSGEKSDRIVYLRYGYYNDGKEMKMITEQKSNLFGSGGHHVVGRKYNDIIKLRERSMFYGKEKDRRRIDEYFDFDETYLNQFGISSKPRVKKPVNILRDYHRSSEVVYFKAKVNSKSRMHVAFMRIDEWVDYVSRVYDKEVNVEVRESCDKENMYCVAYSMEDLTKVDRKNNRRLLHKKIVIDRMIENPAIVSADNLSEMTMKDRRIWFFSRVKFLKNDCIGKWNNFDIKLDGEEQIWNYKGDIEMVALYNIWKDRRTFIEKAICKIFNFITLDYFA